MRAEVFRQLRESLGADEPAVVATRLEGARAGAQLLVRADGSTLGGLGSEALDRAVTARAQELLEGSASERRSFPAEDSGEEASVFLDVQPPRRDLVIVGAVHIAEHLIAFARPLGFRTVVVDPRGVFATHERFAHADELLAVWPQEAFETIRLTAGSYLALLSHDPKLDLPALRLALRSPARYIGALGSKKTHARRVATLREEDFTAEEIARIHAPIGLDLGGRRPEEIALAVMAEIVTVIPGNSPKR